MTLRLRKRRTFLESRPAWALLTGLLILIASCGVTPASLSSRRSSNWVLTWSDEFNGPSALKKWNFDVGGNGWTLKQLQWYGVNNTSIGHGHLIITTSNDGGGHYCWYGPCRYSSVRMMTKGKFAETYGRFEARIKLPGGVGIWPAFWIEGANVYQVGWPACGEIDIIEENGQTPYMAAGYSHAPAHNHQGHATLSKPLAAGYHIYGVDWTPKGISWSVDGHVYSYLYSYAGWPFDHPFYMILDVAVGGKWPGSPSSSTKFPAHMDVDWVRVYRHALRRNM